MGAVSDSKHVTACGWDDCPHLTDKAKKEMLEATPPHMREARSKGVPSAGMGAIYPISSSEITVQPFAIPPFWRRGFALDDGWNRTAVVWGALDPDTDTMYITTEHYQKEGSPQIHAEAIKARGAWMPGVGDAAARTRDGEQILAIYQGLGLKLELADKEVEAGIYDVFMRLTTGRLKVFSTCLNWFFEYQRYHRDEKGKIAKVDDHLMDATRYLCRPSAIQRMIAKPADNIIGSRGHRIGDRRMGY